MAERCPSIRLVPTSESNDVLDVNLGYGVSVDQVGSNVGVPVHDAKNAGISLVSVDQVGSNVGVAVRPGQVTL